MVVPPSSDFSMLVPHLNGESYPMRNAVVTVLGNLLAKAFVDAPEDHGASNQLAAHLRTKQARPCPQTDKCGRAIFG